MFSTGIEAHKRDLFCHQEDDLEECLVVASGPPREPDELYSQSAAIPAIFDPSHHLQIVAAAEVLEDDLLPS